MTGSRPRILFVGPMLGRHPGWVPNPAEELAPRLAASGYPCQLVSDRAGRFARLADILGTILKQRRQTDVVCLQVYSGSSFLVSDLASLLARGLRLPVVMVLHGGGLPSFIEQHPSWTTRVLHRATLLVVPSYYLGESLANRCFSCRVIPNAIDLESYPYRHRASVKPSLLWMRTFHEVYNPCLAVETLQHLKKFYPDARLTMAGQDKGMLEPVKQRVHELNLADSVRFVGFLDLQGKQREFAEHDIFLNTNRVDNMPVSVMEAAAAGMPIVATAVGGVPYLLHDGETGLLTADNDPAAMANAVERILTQPELAGRLSQNARCKAEQLDWSAILPEWEAVFRELAIHA